MAEDQTGGSVKERPKTKRQEPIQYKVVLLNDDYTTMEFVVHILESVFDKSPSEAYRLMLHVHVNGKAVAGIYPWDIAETKVNAVTVMAKDAGYPLRAEIED
jgi:ATP-dependent Clp protease adaptor protein ClpS